MTQTPHLDNIIKKSKLEKQKRAISKVYILLSTLMVIVTIVMIGSNPDRYFNMVAILLLAAVMLIAMQNRQLSRLKPQNL